MKKEPHLAATVGAMSLPALEHAVGIQEDTTEHSLGEGAEKSPQMKRRHHYRLMLVRLQKKKKREKAGIIQYTLDDESHL